MLHPDIYWQKAMYRHTKKDMMQSRHFSIRQGKTSAHVQPESADQPCGCTDALPERRDKHGK